MIRHRDKMQMLAIIEESVTLKLFRDLFTIFYEPLVRVYKSANVYSSVTDFASFVDDVIKTVSAAQRQEMGADPNQTVQAFIDCCARHEDDLYKFLHEVHTHDNGLFDQISGWLEGILEFLRHGPKGGKLDMNALLQGAVDVGSVDKEKAIAEIDSLVDWQMARKRWHQDKTQRKMAANTNTPRSAPPGSPAVATFNGFTSSKFSSSELGVNSLSIDGDDSDSDLEEETPKDAAQAETLRHAELRSKVGEPGKPDVSELDKLRDGFVSLLRVVLAE